jgi:hypothetical protein
MPPRRTIMELDASPDEPDMFGAHEKWSEQSLERVRWVMPVVMAAIGIAGAIGFGFGVGGDADAEDASLPWPLIVVCCVCLAWSVGWLVWAWLGGPWRVEVDQGLRTVKWTHARRFKPKMLMWRFDDIVEYSVLMSVETITTKNDDGMGPSVRKEYDTYWIVLHLRDGGTARIFGKFFDKWNNEARARERLAKLVQLTGKQEKKVDPQEFEKMRAEVEAVLGKHR